MERALVIVEPIDEIGELVREAGELAAGVGADLRIAHVTTNDEYEENREAMQEVARLERGGYDIGQANEGARQFATEVAHEALGDIDVEYEAVGAVGDKADEVLRLADEHDCDHVFIPGRKRSPSGKAIFGDIAQRVILNFDGPVTIVSYQSSKL